MIYGYCIVCFLSKLVRNSRKFVLSMGKNCTNNIIGQNVSYPIYHNYILEVGIKPNHP
jgi:hypothetical protein